MSNPTLLARITERRRATEPAQGAAHAPRPAAATSGARSERRSGEYRSFFTFESSPTALDLILEQTRIWLRGKGFDDSLEETGAHRTAERSLTVIHRDSSHCHDLRIVLSEPHTPLGRWDTEVTVHLPERDSGWVSMHVENDQGSTAAPPRLIRWLLDVLEAHDGSLRLTSTATATQAPDVDDLLDAVCDPDRRGLLFVVGTAETDPLHGRTFADTQARAERWARDSVGLGQVVVLDPLATAAFNVGIGATHGVDPWAVRTYAPDPDPAWSTDARRHRIFSASRLHQSHNNEVGRVLGFSARAHAADRALPSSVAAADRDLSRALDRLVLDTIFTTPTPPTPRATTAGATLAPATPEYDRLEPADPADPAVPAGPTDTVPEMAPEDGDAIEDTATEPVVGASGAAGLDTPAPPQGAVEAGAETASSSRQVASLPELEPTAELADLHATLGLVSATLGLEEVTADTLARYRETVDEAAAVAQVREAHAAEMVELARERFDLQALTIEDLEDDVRFHRDYAVAADELRDEADERARRSAEEAQYFRKQLAAVDQYDLAWGAVPAEAYSAPPDSFSDLIERMSEELAPRGVVFTGDVDLTRRLDSHDTSGRLVRSTWDCLIALVGYLEAKQDGKCSTGVHGYLTSSPPGYPVVSKNKFAPRESTSTMNKYGAERIFRVPESVHDTGQVAMEAHFKLGALGMVSPRLHFHDDTATTQSIYVGYIGPHLTTEQSN